MPDDAVGAVVAALCLPPLGDDELMSYFMVDVEADGPIPGRYSIGRPIFISDNNGFDWQFIN